MTISTKIVALLAILLLVGGFSAGWFLRAPAPEVVPESLPAVARTEVDFIGILNYYQLRDEQGEIVPATEVVEWTVQNSKLPELGLVTSLAEDGLFAATGVSYYKSGIYVGLLGSEILEGSDPATIPIVDPGTVDFTFNLERAEMLGIKIPAAELVEATEVFQTIQ